MTSNEVPFKKTIVTLVKNHVAYYILKALNFPVKKSWFAKSADGKKTYYYFTIEGTYNLY